MNKAGALLAARILAEINDLNTVVKRAMQGWERTKTRNDDLAKLKDFLIKAVQIKEMNSSGFF